MPPVFGNFFRGLVQPVLVSRETNHLDRRKPLGCVGSRISAVEVHPRQRQVEVRLTLRFVVCLEDALRLKLVACLEALLLAGDFVFEIEDVLGTPDQTECLFHCFTHGCECAGIGDCRVSEQWPSVDRAVNSF